MLLGDLLSFLLEEDEEAGDWVLWFMTYGLRGSGLPPGSGRNGNRSTREWILDWLGPPRGDYLGTRRLSFKFLQFLELLADLLESLPFPFAELPRLSKVQLRLGGCYLLQALHGHVVEEFGELRGDLGHLNRKRCTSLTLLCFPDS
jgi:hypothetical protein